MRKPSRLVSLTLKALWKKKLQFPDEWGAQNRIYSPQTGVPGPRNPHLTPYAVPFGRAFVQPRYKRVVMVTAAQSGKTETYMDVIGERMDNRPAPGLYVAPSKEFITDQFEPRFRDMLLQSASLLSKTPGGVDGKRQKQTLKRVNGTRIRFAHAGSSGALKSDPAAYALIDEYDEMLKNIRGQGDPLGLVDARGDTYADFVVGITSTPSLGLIETYVDDATGLEFWQPILDEEEASKSIKSPIWRLWQAGTMHHWCWRCPSCGKWFVPRFKCLAWPKDATPMQALREAHVVCPNNGCIILESAKKQLNARGQYIAPGMAIDEDGDVSGQPADVMTLSLWVSGLASPFKSFGERAAKYLEAYRSRESDKIQTAVNSQFGEVYAFAGGDVPQWQVIHNSAIPYPRDTVPDRVRYLTCGVDVQKNRLVYVVRGWGARATSWLIRADELWGDTAQQQVWDDLGELLAQRFGERLIKLCFVDSGFRPGKKINIPVHRVYDFARRFRRFVFATKGSSHPLVKPIVQSKIEITREGTQDKYGLDLMRLDSDAWKSFVHERLSWPQDRDGAWFVHAEGWPTDGLFVGYCKQLVSEARTFDPATGKAIWLERSRDNHFLDAEALAAAAAHMLNVQNIPADDRSPPPQTVEQVIVPNDEAEPTPPKPAAGVVVEKKRSIGSIKGIASRLNK